MSATLPSPVPTSQFGFTSKAWIAYQLEEIHLGGIHYVWFSTELNPIANGESSNPLQLYSDIDIAVKKKDVNHSKAQGSQSQSFAGCQPAHWSSGSHTLAGSTARNSDRAGGDVSAADLEN